MDLSRSNIPAKMASSSFPIEIDRRPPSEGEVLARHQRLNLAIQNGEWARVQEIFDQDPAARTAAITERSDTPLMVAISSGQSIEFLKKLLNLLSNEFLRQRNDRGNTALHEATIVGYVQAAELLMKKSPSLSIIPNKESYLAIHTAAAYGHGELVTKSLDPSKFLDSESPDASIEDIAKDRERWNWGVMLLHLTISSRMLDKALLLARGLLKVGIDRDLTWRGVSPLELMAQDPYAFSSIIKDWKILRRFIYENEIVMKFFIGAPKFKLIGVPWVKKIHQMKLMHSDASDLVEKVFFHYRRNSETYPINTLMSAVKNGIDEIAVLILDNYPSAIEWKAEIKGEIERKVERDRQVERWTWETGSWRVDEIEKKIMGSQGSRAEMERAWELLEKLDENWVAESERWDPEIKRAHLELEERILRAITYARRKLDWDDWDLPFGIVTTRQWEAERLNQWEAEREKQELLEKLEKIWDFESKRWDPERKRAHLDLRRRTLEAESYAHCKHWTNRPSGIVATKHWEAERKKHATNEVEDEEEGCSALHFAVMYRRENIFTTIFHKIGERKELLWAVDKLNNNILHLVGQMPHQPQLKRVSGAVLQMQRELQWYKKVEEVLPVAARAATNREGMTPIKVFDKEHSNMIKDEKKWFLSMVVACLISTTLIGTIAFTAAIQVPGGISSADGSIGRAQLQKKTAFTIFSVANAVALYSAISTFLIFLSIYASRTATIDFKSSMPKKVISGLICLFFSVISTIVAFDSALVILLSGEPHFTNYCVLGICSSLFVIFLAVIQLLPTLANMIKTTYGSSMFSPVKKKMPSMFSPVDKKRGRRGKRFGEF